MELRQLESFLMVAEEEDFAAAARRLRISQPALSDQVTSLEKELGWELLERGAPSVHLTRAGKVVAWEGRKLMRHVEQARERMTREIDGKILRVGYAPSLDHWFLGGAMERFVARHSGLRVELADATREEMLQALREGSMNLVVDVVGDDPEVEWVPLEEHEWLVVVPRSHRLARSWDISPADLDGERLLLHSKAEYPGYWRQVMDYFEEHGIHANVAGEFDGRASLLTALEAGLGVAMVVSGDQMEKQTGGLVLAKPLSAPAERLRVGVGRSAESTPAPWVVEFVEELRAAAADGHLRGLEDRR